MSDCKFSDKYQTSCYHFPLTDELIAQYPTKNRSDSRLLHFKDNQIYHRTIQDFPDLLHKDDLLVINNSKTIKARLWAQKDSGAKVQILLEKVLDSNRFLAQCQANKPIKIKQKLFLLDQANNLSEIWIKAVLRQEVFIEFETNLEVWQLIEQFGHTPLPPYIKRTDESIDILRYQTIFAKQGASIACPTAGLHFDDYLLAKIKNKGVKIVEICLNVGSGTFKPVKAENINNHHMHAETYQISKNASQILNETIAAKKKGIFKGKIIALGSTSTRSLESNYLIHQYIKAGQFSTDLFIKPDFKFQVIDAMLTNFHTPSSTLVIMVASFMGYDNWKKCYLEALKQKYRFLSYGDAMFIEKN